MVRGVERGELEDEKNGLCVESFEDIRSMVVDRQAEGVGSGVRDSGMVVDEEGDKKNAGKEYEEEEEEEEGGGQSGK